MSSGSGNQDFWSVQPGGTLELKKTVLVYLRDGIQ